MANERHAGRANRVRAYLQLMRFPAVFTALADIFLGFLLTHDTLAPVEEFVLLALAASGLYLSGMVLNDLFDRHIDARERPGRPIPSGRVSLPAAAALGCGLMAVGPLSAAFVGLSSLAIALVLVGLIVAYDRFLKHLPVGPVAMGACRFFNVLLGASAVGSHTWAPPQVFVALAMGVYVAGVTWFARQEAGQSSRSHLAASTAICHAAIVGLAVIAIQSPQTATDSRFAAVAALVLVAVWIDMRLLPAIRDPLPGTVQAAVKQMLLAIVLLDATMVGCKTGDLVLAIAVAALFIPAATLGRWIFIT